MRQATVETNLELAKLENARIFASGILKLAATRVGDSRWEHVADIAALILTDLAALEQQLPPFDANL